MCWLKTTVGLKMCYEVGSLYFLRWSPRHDKWREREKKTHKFLCGSKRSIYTCRHFGVIVFMMNFLKERKNGFFFSPSKTCSKYWRMSTWVKEKKNCVLNQCPSWLRENCHQEIQWILWKLKYLKYPVLGRNGCCCSSEYRIQVFLFPFTHTQLVRSNENLLAKNQANLGFPLSLRGSKRLFQDKQSLEEQTLSFLLLQ